MLVGAVLKLGTKLTLGTPLGLFDDINVGFTLADGVLLGVTEGKYVDSTLIVGAALEGPDTGADVAGDGLPGAASTLTLLCRIIAFIVSSKIKGYLYFIMVHSSAAL